MTVTGADPLQVGPLEIVEHPAARDVQYLEDRVDEYNIARTGIADVRLLTILLRDGGCHIVAGLHGWTWGLCCEVKTLWVHDAWRKRGIGTRLMHAAEAEARSRGAKQIVLSTHSFQARAFYRRLGFESVGRVRDYPVGHDSIYLRKQLR